MIFPFHKPEQINAQASPFEQLSLTDFTGGMNNFDPPESLPANAFTLMSNLLLSRQGVLRSRSPYRPYSFSTGIAQTKMPTVQGLNKILDYKVIQAEVADWSYNGEIHVVVTYHTAGDAYRVYAFKGGTDWSAFPVWADATAYDAGDIVLFNGIYYECQATSTIWDAGDEPYSLDDIVYYTPTGEYYKCVVASTSNDPPHADWSSVGSYKTLGSSYWTRTDPWVELWGASDSAGTVTAVSIVPYIINKAVDVLIFPDSDHPQRYAFKADTLTDLGLTPPDGSTDQFAVVASADDFEVTRTWQSNTAAMELTISTDIYYKFAYFYDDENQSTQYGESPVSDDYFTCAVATSSDGQYLLQFSDDAIPAGVSKIRIYRAPYGNTDGPYRYIGETDVSGADGAGGGTVDDYTDTTPWNQEGDVGLLDVSNPSTSGSEVKVVNVRSAGGAVIGFEADLPNKMVWCDPGYPDVWNPINFDYVLGNGKAVVEFNRKLYCFTDQHVYEKGSLSETAYRISNVGTVDGLTVRNVGRGICWVGTDSVYFADFVQQYGSKGDFPKDIGHPIVASVLNADQTEPMHAVFFEQRYWLTFFDSTEQIQQTYILDIDFASWHYHTLKHTALAAGKNQLFSAGKEVVEGTTYFYVFEHDYSEVVTTGDWSTYDGWDQHDYKIVASDASEYQESMDIAVLLEREQVRLTGYYNKTFVSSITLFAEGDAVDVDVSLVNESDVERTVNFALEAVSTSPFPAYYDDADSVYDGDDEGGDADEDEHGYADLPSSRLRDHKKINRTVKDTSFTVRLQSSQARRLKINLLGMRFRPLPQVA